MDKTTKQLFNIERAINNPEQEREPFMIYVAICDDETKIGAELERTLIDIFSKLSVKLDVTVFFSGEELCKAIESGSHYDLIFLDIEFAQNKKNGVEVGRLIRDKHNDYIVSIVYISRVKSYALELFDTQPFNFLVKPLRYEKIDEVIRKYIKVSGLWLEDFTYKIGHDAFKVKVKDIIYFESYGKKIILHFVSGKKEEFYGSIKELYQEQLKGFDFLFIHTSYIVNYDYITALKFNQVFFVDSITPLPISKHRKNEVRERYYEIMKRRRV